MKIPRLPPSRCVFDILSSLRLSPEVADGLAELSERRLIALTSSVPGKQQASPGPGGETTTAHLMLVYGPLCRCVSVRDERVRAYVRDLLSTIGGSIGLR